MADVDDRQRSFVAYALEVGDQFVAAGLVEVRQRLVEQQDARLRQQGAAERHALRFAAGRSEEHTSELQSLMRISYAVFCLKKKTTPSPIRHHQHYYTPRLHEVD